MVILFDCKVIAICIILYLIMAFCLRKKGLIFLGVYTLFYIYMVQVIRITQFPIYNTEFERELIGQVAIGNGINLIPFANTLDITSVLNVIMFIPFGTLVPLLCRRRWPVYIFLGMFFSVLLEGLQLIVALLVGYTFRVVDVNDIIFNTLGVVIGYIIFSIMIRIIKKICKDPESLGCDRKEGVIIQIFVCVAFHLTGM